MVKKYFFFIITVGFFFLITDIIYKIYFDYLQNKKNHVTSNNSYHHTLKKNFIKPQNYLGKEFKIFTNSLGFKDFEIRKIEKKVNNKRFVFIGDSMTEGVGIEFESTYIGQISKKLNKKNIETLNAGVQSYSPIIYWKKIKDLIELEKLEFNQLVVFLDPSDLDDEQTVYELDEYQNVVLRDIRDKYGNLKSISGFERFKLLVRRHTLYTYIILRSLNAQYKKMKNSYHSWEREVDKNDFRLSWSLKKESEYTVGLDLMKKYMIKLNELCIKNNVKLTIVVYPLPFHVWNNDFDSIHVSTWENFSKKNNIYFINFFPFFVKEAATRKEKLNILNKFYIPEDVHFNREGHKKISELFIEKFKY